MHDNFVLVLPHCSRLCAPVLLQPVLQLGRSGKPTSHVASNFGLYPVASNFVYARPVTADTQSNGKSNSSAGNDFCNDGSGF
mmetsp:Transcript_22487/g.43037  ORF Transcript_22487/g.43037 Transcript_22487/m.43037 type:complete len:82 (+) Transcript_22487:99-344(+)